MVRKKASIVRLYLVSLLAMLSFPLILGIIIYKNIEGSYENELRQSLTGTLEYIVGTFEKDVKDTRVLTQTIQEDKSIQAVLNLSGDWRDGRNPLYVLAAKKALEQHKLKSDFIETIWIYFKAQDLLISPNEIVEDLSEHYDEGTVSFGTLDFSRFEETILRGRSLDRRLLPTVRIGISDLAYDVIPYLDGSTELRVMTSIKTDAVAVLFRLLGTYPGLFYGIFNADGEAVFSNNEEIASTIGTRIARNQFASDGTIDIFKKEYSFVLTRNADSGVGYVFAVPYDNLFKKLAVIRQNVIIAFLSVLAIGLTTAYLIARRQARPLLELVNDLKAHMPTTPDGETGSYDFIKSCLSDLYYYRNEYLDGDEEQKNLIKRYVSRLLLNGELEERTDGSAIFTVLDIAPGHGFSVLVCKTEIGSPPVTLDRSNTLQESSRVRSAMQDIAIRSLFMNKSDEFVFLLVHQEPLAVEDLDYVQSAIREIIDLPPDTIRVGIGSMYSNLFSLHESYRQARHALSFARFNTVDAPVLFENMPSERDDYAFPVEWATRLSNFVRIGKIEETESILAEIERSNFIDRSLNEDAGRLLAYDLILFQRKLYRSLGVETENIPDINIAGADIGAMYSRFKISIVELVKKVHQQLRQDHPAVDRIERYVRERIADTQLSLTSIADSLNYSENYISGLYHKYRARTIGSFIAEERIRLAKQIISTTDIPVSEIHQRIGYGSYRNFRRVFKKTTGLLPDEYRSSPVRNEHPS